jgi:hypothetical protein
MNLSNNASNKSLQATRDGGFRRRQGYGGQASSTSRFTLVGPAFLSSGRWHHRAHANMKTTHSLFAISLLALAGCSTMHQTGGAKADSETVMVTYHVQSGRAAEFQALLSHGWEVYRGVHLVFAEPHIIVRDTEDGDKTRFVEIFTWVKSPDHAPDSVQAVWKQEQSLCEARNGHKGIEGGEVEMVTGR